MNGIVVSLLRRLAIGAPALGLVVALAAPATAQQTGSVSGTVVDAVTGVALVGARVTLLSTGELQRTSVNGTFLFQNIPVGEVQIRALLVGYSNVTASTNVVVGQPVELNFELRRLAIELDDLVVTGTAGEVRRRQVGTALSNIAAADFVDLAPVQSVDEIMRGRMTGATIMQNSGQVGSAATIVLRGPSSVMMSNQPLIYVDGVRMYQNFLPDADEVGNAASPALDVDPRNIERIEVVKGAAATTLYGTEASAGVIQIFTKKGTAGRPSWSLFVEGGFNSQGHIGPSPGADYLPTAAEAGSDSLAQVAQDFAATGMFTNDCREADPEGCPADGSFLRTAWQARTTLNVRGGSQTTNYFVSGTWDGEEGIIDPQGAKTWGIRGNFGFEPATGFTVQFNTRFSRQDIIWIPDGDNAEGFMLNAFRRENGYTPQDNDALILDMKLDQAIDHFTTGLASSWVAGAFSNRLTLGLDYIRSEYTEERPFGYFRVPAGDRENETWNSTYLTLDYAGTWSANFGSSHSSAFSWGGQIFSNSTRFLNAFGDDFGLPGAKKDIDAAAVTSAGENIVDLQSGGFFFQEVLGLWDQLFLTGGIRFDGFSTFGRDFGLAAYPKVSASYLLSDYGFWPSWWDVLKLRGAWGWSGRAPGTFDATRTWDAIAGDDGQPGVTPSNPGDPGLGPEKTREFEVGMEGSMFGGRLSFDFSLYDQLTSDALIGVQQVPSQGFVSQQLRNVGDISNKGVEVALTGTVVAARGFDWELGARYYYNKSEAVDLGGEILPIRGSAAVEIREGFAVPGVFGPKLKDPNAVGDGAVTRCTVPQNRQEFDSDPDACGYAGPNMPTYSLGLTTRFTMWRRLTVDALGEAQGGNFISLGTARQTVRRNVWPECIGVRDRVRAGDVGNLTAEQQGLCANAPTFIDWARKADYFRLRHVTLAYRLPESWMPAFFRGLTVRASGKNLLLVAKDFRGLDPEAMELGSVPGANSSGAGVGFRYSYYNLPLYRTFLFNFSLDF